MILEISLYACYALGQGIWFARSNDQTKVSDLVSNIVIAPAITIAVIGVLVHRALKWTLTYAKK